MDDIASAGQVTQLPDVGKHKATQWTGAIRACVVTLGLTKTSRVDVQGIAGTDTKKTCDLALQVAKLAEAGLPQGMKKGPPGSAGLSGYCGVTAWWWCRRRR